MPRLFGGSQIRILLKYSDSVITCEVEANAWNVFSGVVQTYLENREVDNQEIVQELFLSLQAIGCRISIKLPYLHSHLGEFEENLVDVGEEQRKRFNQDVKIYGRKLPKPM